MRFTTSILNVLGAVSFLALVADTSAIPVGDLRENYQPIIDRNPFGLRPPPPPPTNNVAPAKQEKPKLEVFLTGITSIGYPRLPKQVFLKTQEHGKKEPNYYALSEGVEKDGIKVLEIDPANRKVRIRMNDDETLLSFETHGISAPAGPAPGQPGQPGMTPQPGVVPMPLPNAGAQPGMNNMVQPQPITQPQQPQNSSTFRQIPSRRIRANDGNVGFGGSPQAAPPGVVQQQAQEAPVDPVQQYLNMHLNKAVNERQGIPMPPLPPM